MNYTVIWKPINNKSIMKSFDSNKNKKYWIPFKYGNKYYLMTFNHLYEVVL